MVREDGMLPAEKARASWRTRLKRPGDGNSTMSDAMREQLQQAAQREHQQEEQSQSKLERAPKRRFDLAKEVCVYARCARQRL